MRNALVIALAISMSAAVPAWAQNTQAPNSMAAPAATPAPAPHAAPAAATCNNPNALGVARVVQIDTTGGPGFGFEQFKAYDFLRDHEVVLTFDDGPWPGNTPRVLKALADQCTKALFFPIGKHAGWHPEILKEVVAAGHTVGSHTWSHKDLTRLTTQEATDEIEKGIAAVSVALGNKPVGPFFRFPALRNPPEMVKYLGERNVGIFSTDMDSFDFKMRRPEQVIKSVMAKLEKHGKGIILMHDFQHATSEALPEILKRLKDGGYKIVQVTGKTPVEPKKEYVEAVLKEMGGGLEEARPMSSVVKDVSGN
ncbi:MAG TPA: polysaccharide deacetylase family protein [Pseudolabrys sp.]|nr:polysaccharide deacetylase family protein [Pseudolabrys sp.]